MKEINEAWLKGKISDICYEMLGEDLTTTDSIQKLSKLLKSLALEMESFIRGDLV